MISHFENYGGEGGWVRKPLTVKTAVGILYISRELYLTNVFIYLVKFCSWWFVTMNLDPYLQRAIGCNDLFRVLSDVFVDIIIIIFLGNVYMDNMLI